MNVAELKAELQNANNRLADMSNRLAAVNLEAHRLCEFIAELVDCHNEGKKDQIDMRLQELSDWQRRISKAQAHH